ncbi:MAG TPA: hypothetical protein VFB21_24695 [Chthonomonadaceae bacterium]|nr:hypothetical protein [Chthonomonadaceae bacterium]
MPNTVLSPEEIGRRGRALYEQSIRDKVETEENIGKMVIIDVETGEYGVDETGLETSRRLHVKRPDAPLYGIRIGYNVSAAIGGVMERVTR